MTTALSSNPTLPVRSALTAGLLGGAAATLANVIIYYLFQSLNGGSLIVGGAPLPLVAVLLSSLLPGVAAGGVYWALARFTRTPTRWFLVLAGTIFVIAAVAPLIQTAGLALWALELMHLGAALPITLAVLRVR